MGRESSLGGEKSMRKWERWKIRSKFKVYVFFWAFVLSGYVLRCKGEGEVGVRV